MASLDDIFTTQKNGVVAINSLVKYMNNISNKIVGTQFYQGAATTGLSTLYTTPTGATSYLTEINIVNTAATAANFSIYVVSLNGTAATTNALFYQAPIQGNTIVQWQGSVFLPAGTTVQAQGSTTSINFYATGGSVA